MSFLDLFRPKWKNSNWEVRRDAVGSLDDQKLLADIAKYDIYEEVRIAAVKKIEDQEVLADIAKNDNEDISSIAIRKIKEPDVIADIAKHAWNTNIRISAVKKLKDQELLAWVAKNDRYVDSLGKYPVRVAAVKKFENQDLLAEFARIAEYWCVRWIAVEMLDSDKWQDLLADITKSDTCILVQRTAIDKLNPKVYKKLITQENSRQIGIKHPQVLEADKIKSYDDKKALDILENLVKNDPSSLEGAAYHVIGYIYMVKGDLDLALSAFNINLKIFPDDPSTCMCLGLIYELKGSNKKAKEYYSKAPDREWDPAYIEKINRAYANYS